MLASYSFEKFEQTCYYIDELKQALEDYSLKRFSFAPTALCIHSPELYVT
jgi:hypothetical protein